MASRNTFTFVANIFVLLTALLLFIVLDDSYKQFRILGIIIVIIGLVSSVFYIFTIKEPYLVKEAKKLQKEFKLQNKALYQAEESEKERVKSMSMAVKQWYVWFKEGQFYVYGFVYTLVRMAVNVVMTVQSFYLIHVLKFE